MERDARKLRGDMPQTFTNLKTGTGVDRVIDWIRYEVLFDEVAP